MSGEKFVVEAVKFPLDLWEAFTAAAPKKEEPRVSGFTWRAKSANRKAHDEHLD
jgi:hypothetical protein